MKTTRFTVCRACQVLIEVEDVDGNADAEIKLDLCKFHADKTNPRNLLARPAWFNPPQADPKRLRIIYMRVVFSSERNPQEKQ